MGAAAGGAGPARGGVLARLACVPSSCSLCSASVWERSRYAALQGYCRPAEEMLKVPSYSPPGESSKDCAGLTAELRRWRVRPPLAGG
ncbi:unnamed protein product, partial [Prorocentrum cordatum]